MHPSVAPRASSDAKLSLKCLPNDDKNCDAARVVPTSGNIHSNALEEVCEGRGGIHFCVLQST
jgi:hypothetical protein